MLAHGDCVSKGQACDLCYYPDGDLEGVTGAECVSQDCFRVEVSVESEMV